MKKSLANVSTKLNLPKGVSKRLAAKMAERNDDLLLDKLEQMEIHKREYARLKKEVEEMAKFEIL